MPKVHSSVVLDGALCSLLIHPNALLVQSRLLRFSRIFLHSLSPQNSLE
jgi:hypothetical protein